MREDQAGGIRRWGSIFITRWQGAPAESGGGADRRHGPCQDSDCRAGAGRGALLSWEQGLGAGEVLPGRPSSPYLPRLLLLREEAWSSHERERDSQSPARLSCPVRAGVSLIPSCSLRCEGDAVRNDSTHARVHTRTYPYSLFPECLPLCWVLESACPPPTAQPSPTPLSASSPHQETWQVLVPEPACPPPCPPGRSPRAQALHPAPSSAPLVPRRGLFRSKLRQGPVWPLALPPQGRLTDGLQRVPSRSRGQGRVVGPAAPKADARSGAGFWAGWLCGLWVLTETIWSLLRRPRPKPWPGSSPTPWVFTASPLGLGQPEATGWKQGCGSPTSPDGRSPCPAPQDSLHTHPPFLPRPTWPPFLCREQSVWPEGQPPGSVGVPPGLPSLSPLDQLHCAHASLSGRDAISRTRLQLLTPWTWL